MPARLISLDGHADIPLDRLLVVVGRHRRCDARIDSLRVSRRHCCLGLEGGGVLVRDLGSVNGTWINGARIEDGFLRPGDELAIAHLRYALDLGPAGGAGRPGMPRNGEPGPELDGRPPQSDGEPVILDRSTVLPPG